MKKFWIIGTLAALALIAFGVVGYAYAQSQDSDSPNGCNRYGCGMFGAGSAARERRAHGPRDDGKPW